MHLALALSFLRERGRMHSLQQSKPFRPALESNVSSNPIHLSQVTMRSRSRDTVRSIRESTRGVMENEDGIDS